MNMQPLVSVVVVTYNSSLYVLETLKSIQAQTYSNIELIITDDCSSDDTVEICRKWLKKNEKRFVRTQLVTSSQNTGIPANYNRGIRLAKGEWIKGIAGDDILTENSLASFINACKAGEWIVVGACQAFFVDKEGKRIINMNILPDKRRLPFYYLEVSSQYRYMLFESPVIAPSVVIHKKIFEEVGFFDENYKYIEDYPFWFKCVSLGYRISFLDVLMVYYRCQHESMTSSNAKIYNKDYWNSLYKFRKEKIYPNVSWYNIIFWQNECVQKCKYWILCFIFCNKKNKMSLFFGKIIAILSVKRLWYYLCVK